MMTRLICALALVLPVVAASAAEYPERAVRVIVTFPAGGGTDIVARMVLQKVAERSGATFVIDNRGGAGGTIGTDLAAGLQAMAGGDAS